MKQTRKQQKKYENNKKIVNFVTVKIFAFSISTTTGGFKQIQLRVFSKALKNFSFYSYESQDLKISLLVAAVTYIHICI